jgi:hypothetical protein
MNYMIQDWPQDKESRFSYIENMPAVPIMFE